MNKKTILILIVCCITSLFIIGGSIALTAEKNQMDKSAASYVESIKEKGFLTAADDEAIAVVDGWKITQSDLNNRINEYKLYNKEADYTEIMDVLFEEAALFSQAEALGVLPTDEEVAQYIKEIYEDKEFSSYLKNNKTINDSAKYYAFKFLAYYNVYHYFLDEGRELELITPEWTYAEDVLSKYSYGNGDDYYVEKCIEYKKSVVWSSTIDGFKPVLDKLVL